MGSLSSALAPELSFLSKLLMHQKPAMPSGLTPSSIDPSNNLSSQDWQTLLQGSPSYLSQASLPLLLGGSILGPTGGRISKDLGYGMDALGILGLLGS